MALGLATSGQSGVPAQAAPSAATPSFVVVMVDDLALRSFSRRTMPRTLRLLKRAGGTRFTSALATPPLCCPSRAGFQTGRYPHNHGVFSNDYGSLREKHDVLPVWLSNAGYRTGFVGKFMNGYESSSGTANPPGFHRSWRVGDNTSYFGYDITVQGERRSAGSGRRDYLTTATTRQGTRFIEQATTGSTQPFFLWLSYFAPHAANSPDSPYCKSGPLPLREDWRRHRGAPVAVPPSFNERDISDKEGYLSNRTTMSPRAVRRVKQRVRCVAASLAEVDRGVAKTMRALRRQGVDDQTAVLFVSDNGFFFGEHRLRKGKLWPYEEALRVPMLLRVPARMLGGSAASKTGALVSNIDIAPTILDLAGLASPTVMDGRSLVPLLRGEAAAFKGRAMLSEAGPGACGTHRAVRTRRYLYLEYLNRHDCEFAGAELYDLRADPHQLESIVSQRPDLARKLARMLRDLEDCQGTTGSRACP